MGWSGVSIVSITILLVGIIMVMIGVILLMTTREVKPFYDWLLIGVGVAIALFGGLLLSSYHSTPHIQSDVKANIVTPAISAVKRQSNSDDSDEPDFYPDVTSIEAIEPNFGKVEIY